MNAIRELSERLQARKNEARALLDAVEQEKRPLTADERDRYDALVREAEDLSATIQRMASVTEDRSPAVIGLSDREVRQYSMARAIQAMARVHDGVSPREAAPYEFEVSDAAAKRLGKTPRGILVPWDVLSAERRAGEMVVGTAGAGGYLKPTDELFDSFIDVLRNRMVARQAGAQVLTGLVGDVMIPKKTVASTGYWIDSDAAEAVTKSKPTLGQVTLSPKTLGGYTEYSHKLLRQSAIAIEGFVREDLAATLQVEADRVVFHGAGSTAGQPTGIAATTGIGAVAGGTNGADPTWDHVVKLETEVAIDNADVGRLAYITNAKVRGKLKTTFRNATYGEIPVWGDGDILNGYQAYVTNQIASNLVKGTSSNCSAIFFGNWADVLIGLWGGLEIVVNPYSLDTYGTVRVVALMDMDVAVRRAESFAAMLDALTA